MNFFKDKIVFTGGSGKFGSIFSKEYNSKNFFYPSKKEMNVEEYSSVFNFLTKIKPKAVIHAAAISRPMKIHEKNPEKSIKVNIIGTSNITIACKKLKIKIIYISTNYVYAYKKISSKETDPVKPINKYGLSKLGGECAVQMYDDSLILRVNMSEKPFVHKKAYADVITNYMYHDEVVKLFPILINVTGIINIGGKKQSIYHFAKSSRPKVKKIFAKNILKEKYFKHQNICTEKLKKLYNEFF